MNNLSAAPPPSFSPAPEVIGNPGGSKNYEIGSLHYTLRGVCVLFAWLLGGDFALAFFENIFGRFLPLYLNDLHASNGLIGLMTGSIAGALNLFFMPGISQWSDRCRTKWGRRIPFLAIVAPLTVVSLILVGFAPEIGGGVHQLLAHVAPAVSETTVILGLLCVFVACFHYCNMILVNAFNWLLRDVVPQELMARFLSWFRLVSTISTIAFSWYLFPYVITRRREICVGVGLFYLVVFFLMCWKVREGDYPPPPEKNRPGVIKSFGLYFKECFAVTLYRRYFYSVILGAMGGSAGPFFLLFYRDNLRLDMTDLGKVFALGNLITALALLPIGWLCDKFTPIRVAILAQIGMFLMAIFSFFFLNGRESLIVFTVMGSSIAVAWGLGSTAMSMKLFPAEKFGQFFSGTNIFGMATGILANYLVGIFLDAMHSDYRMAYLWSAISGLSVLPLLLVYRGWKEHGGPDHYVPPPTD